MESLHEAAPSMHDWCSDLVSSSHSDVEVVARRRTGSNRPKVAAQKLSISPSTVRTHVKSIFRKLECSTRAGHLKGDAVRFVIDHKYPLLAIRDVIVTSDGQNLNINKSDRATAVGLT